MRVAGNTIAILTSDVLNRTTTFVLYALVARHLGAFEFGQMSLALVLFYTFQVIAVAGLRMFLTREVARDKTATARYLVNASALVVVSSLLSMSLLLLFARSVGYAPGTTSAIALMSLALLPHGLSAVFEAIFQAWERMHYIAYANAPVHVAKTLVAALALWHGLGLYHLLWVLVLGHVAVAVIEWRLLARLPIASAPLSPALCRRMLRAATPFLGIDSLVALKAGVIVLLLSKLENETTVGLYASAAQLLVPVTLVYQGLVVSIFPMMCRSRDRSVPELKRVFSRLLELLLVVALPSAVGLFFLADRVLLLVYGREGFVAAAEALRIMVGSLVFLAMTHALGHALFAALRERTNLRIVAVDTLLSLALGYLFIERWGLNGAALALVVVRGVSLVLHFVSVARIFRGVHLAGLSWRPVVATAGMASFLVLVPDLAVPTTVMAGALVYAGVFLALVLASEGGLSRLKTTHSYLWSD